MKIAPFGFVLGGRQGLAGVRIAHLIETDGPGGAERVLSLLATEQQSAGATSVAFLPVRREGWLKAELSSAGVPVEYVPLNARALGAGAQARAQAEFHVSRMVAHYADMYRDALNRASS